MKINAKRIVQLIIGVVLATAISYCIASILIIGSIKAPVIFGNDSFKVENYTQEQIVKKSEYLEVVSRGQYKTGTFPFSRINLNYGNKREDKTGYLLLDIGVISEENVDVRVCIFKSEDDIEFVATKVNEGMNVLEIPLEDAKKLRVDFMTTLPIDLTIDKLAVTNQLVGVLPLSWYICFAFCFFLMIEIICACLSIEIKLQKKICGYIVKGAGRVKEEVAKLCGFVMEHKWAFLICFLICIFAYAYNLMNFSLGVDEERDIVRSIGSMTNVKELLLREGRYGLYLFRALETVDGSFTAFVGELLSIIFIFLNIVVGAKCFDIVTKGKIKDNAIIIFGGMLATLPFINAEIMCYSIMNAGVYFSMMLTTLALMAIASFYENKLKSRLVWAFILTVLAMLFTEAHNVWFITGTVLINLVWVMSNQNIKWLDWIKYVLHYAGVFLLSFVVCMVIRLIVGQNGYAEGYIQWGSAKPLTLIKGIWDWLALAFTSNMIPGAIYLLVGIVIFIGFILIYMMKERWSRAILILLLSVCLIITPFLLCIVAGAKMPYRTLEALLLLEAGAWFIVINFIDKKMIARYVLVATAFFIIWNQGVWMNRIFYGADLNARLDMEMGYAIGEKVEQVTNTTQVEKPVVVVGAVQHSSPNIYRIDAVGQSIFYREPPMYKTYYLRYLGFRFPQPNNEQIEQANELATDMSVWPLDDSVKEFEDIVVVKLN